MKVSRLVICAAVISAFTVHTAKGWGGVGHAAVAQVAENHLTKKAKAKLDEYLGGKTLHEVASDADKYRHEWVSDIGRKIENPGRFRFKKWGEKFDWSLPSNIEPYPHSFTAYCNFTPYRDIFETKNGKEYGVTNCVYYIDQFARELKANAANMDPQERSRKIRMIVHFVGDMHCPGHCVYLSDSLHVVRSSTTFILQGSKVNLHKFWDGGIYSKSWPKKKYDYVAGLADNYEKVKFSKKITKGDVWDWARDVAGVAYTARMYNGRGIVKNQEVPEKYIEEMQPICLRQVRNGGYRLAALLNDIFK